jgi:hypothetical protein
MTIATQTAALWFESGIDFSLWLRSQHRPMEEQVLNVIYTAKRLSNLAQGCRAARLPWVTGPTIAIVPQRGCVRISRSGGLRNSIPG